MTGLLVLGCGLIGTGIAVFILGLIHPGTTGAAVLGMCGGLGGSLIGAVIAGDR